MYTFDKAKQEKEDKEALRRKAGGLLARRQFKFQRKMASNDANKNNDNKGTDQTEEADI